MADKDKNEYAKNKVSAVEQDIELIEQKETIDKSFRELMNDTNLLKSTDLTTKEIKKLNIIYTYAKKFGFNNLVDLVENFMRMKISHNRKGRIEIKDIASASILHDERIAKIYNNSKDSRLK